MSLGDAVGELERDNVGVAEPERDGVGLGDPEPVVETVGEPEPLVETVGDPEPDTVVLGEGDVVTDDDTVTVVDTVPEGEADGDPDIVDE